MSELTQILSVIQPGQTHTAEELVPLVYDELRRLAAYHLAQEKPGQTLQATALVHEAWLRLIRTEDQRFQNRAHFFGAAAEAMRRILVENARRKHRQKRGGHGERIALEELELPIEAPGQDVLAIHEALEGLEQADDQAALLVKLRFFAGLTLGQCAELLNVSARTADNIWAFAKAWLYRALNEPGSKP